ncbi:MAG: extracellular solute-binding protein [Thermomicrobiales bacterium]|nr:extracellular solute-binding protein [Thermomicrobiales bacterium]
MQRIRPWGMMIAVIALLCSLMAGPLLGQVRAQEQVELRVWDQFVVPEESAVADALYAAFMEANPNVTIVREAFQTAQMRDTVNTAISSGSGPDVIFYDAGPGYAGVLVDAGFLLPLTEYAAQYGWDERVAPPSQEATSINGVLYGMPLQTDLIGMYYNQTLLDQEGLTAPSTLDEMVAFCAAATEKGYIPIAFSNNPGWSAFHQFSMTANQNIGPEAMREILINNNGRWDTPEIVEAITAYFVTLQDAGCFPDGVNAIPYDDGNALFYTGQALLNTSGSWLASEIATNMPDYDVQFVPFPIIKDGNEPTWISGVGSAFYINASTAHPDEAAALLDFLFSQEAVEQWLGEAKYFVPVDFDASALELDPTTAQIVAVLQDADTSGLQFGYNVDVMAPPAFNEMMQNGFQAVLNGDKTAEAQAADLQAAWEAGMPAAEATPAS